jgi:hypothetical protein
MSDFTAEHGKCLLKHIISPPLSYTNPFGYNCQMTQSSKRSPTTAVVPSTFTESITTPDTTRHDGWTRERMIAQGSNRLA